MSVHQYPGWPGPMVRVDTKTYYVRHPAPDNPASMNGGLRPYLSYLKVDGLDEAPAIEQKRLILTIGPVGNEGGTLEVWFPLEGANQFGDAGVHVRRGCFSDSLADFEADVEKKRSGSTLDQYRRIIAAIKLIAGEV